MLNTVGLRPKGLSTSNDDEPEIIEEEFVDDLLFHIPFDDESIYIKDESNGVSQINNKINNSLKLETTTSEKPKFIPNLLNGLGGLRVSSNPKTILKAENTMLDTPYTIIYLSRQIGGQNQRVLAGLHANWLLGYWRNKKDIFYDAGWINTAAKPPDKLLHIYTLTDDGITETFYGDGITNLGTKQHMLNSKGLLINAFNGNNIESSDAELFEILKWDRVLPFEEIQLVYTYLHEKWGLDI